MLWAMAERAIGAGVRAIRIRAGMTQLELSIAADVPRSVVQAIERDRISRVRVGDVRAVATALDATVDLSMRWRGGDLPRLVNARHAAIHEVVAARYLTLPDWQYEPEVSFSSYGERGVVDGLGWHAGTRALLIHEYKSDLVDLSDLMGTVDQKRRLAPEIVRERGWRPASVSTWVVVIDSRSNRRALARHEAALRSKFPADGHAVGAWLRHPVGRLDALSFLPLDAPNGTGAAPTATRLVRRPRDLGPEPASD
jgi:transcriptional regulator with XRE-family HTH domain